MSPRPDKGYHIRQFPTDAQRLAKAGACLADTSVGEWIAEAVREKFDRDLIHPQGAVSNG